MMIDLVLLAIFLAAAGVAVAAVGRKIPVLFQVPHQLIEESFVTRPSRVAASLAPAIAFVRERRYRDLYISALVRVLHGLRLWLLRLERITYRTLEALQERTRNLSEAEERYWSELKQWKHETKQNGNHIPEAVLTEAAPAELTSQSPREV